MPSLPPVSRRPFPIPFLLLAVALLACASGCRKPEKFSSSPVTLEFSEDTIFFDTVFTTIGTVTKRFVVRNTGTDGVRVDVALEGGSPSPFRINVDGSSGLSFSQVEIQGRDSIYVFVEATLDANNVANPLIIEDRILFNTNGNEQHVQLVAWGRDAHFFRPDRYIPGLPPFSIIAGVDDSGNPTCETVTWPNDKPYVIFGYAVVDSCSTLIIEPGVTVYMHGGAGLWAYRYGRILAEGTVDQRITFRHDRQEPLYDNLPGQWERIWINDGPAGNDSRFVNVVVRNALVGFQCENWPGQPTAPTSEARLVLNNVQVRNCSAAGILSRNYRIQSVNLLVADCGQYAMALTGGGQYTFEHTTIANFWTWDIRNTPSFILTNTYEDLSGTIQVREIFPSSFRNGIIHGNITNEFKVSTNSLAPVDWKFFNYLLRTDQPTNAVANFPDQTTIYRNLNPGFVAPTDGDFHLLSTSLAINKGTTVGAPPEAFFDLDGNLRAADGQADLGCYEFTP